MKLAHIAPTSMLGHLPASQKAHLALSKLIVDNMQYARFYRNQVKRNALVILDSPVHENLTPNLGEWVTALGWLRPSVAILPDIIDDAEGTVKSAIFAADQARHYPGIQLMGVPHGKDNAEFLDCAQELVHGVQVKWLGISLERRLENDVLAYQRRVERIRCLARDPVFAGVNIHLLGISEAARELREPLFRRVTSADTSKFAVYYLSGNPAVPPSPLNKQYPGRAALGGSFEYFNWRPSLPSGSRLGEFQRGFLDNLSRWSDYAATGSWLTSK